MSSQNPKILVTGSAGFMGSHLVDFLIERDHQVLGIDNLAFGTDENVSAKAKKNFFKIDLRDQKKVKDFVKKYRPEIIYHLAASAHEGLSQFAPIDHTENNYNGYLNLLVSAINNGLKRLVLFSSMAIYGDQKPPFTEDMQRIPADIYGVAKAAMEQATEILADVFKFEYVILRPHNVYGPRQNLADPYRNVVAIFINCLLRNKPFYIYGDGQQKRAFSYIDDITEPIAKAGFLKAADHQIINIGPEKEHTVNYLAKLVLAAFQSNLQPIYVAARPREVKEAYCSAQKARELLGFRQKVTLREGVRLMVEWAKSKGPQKPRYFESLEIPGPTLPLTWQKRLI